MKFGKTIIAAVIGAGALAIGATSASAYVVCNREGECWHQHNRYVYPGAYGVVVHEDNWRWGAHDRYRWHEHPEGRGYWRSGVWINF